MLLLHLEGVSFIQWLQTTFSGFADVLLFLTRMGDPRHAFLVYFPLALVFSRSVGLRTLLVAIISEWTNLILKWMLHGERPFWWIKDPEIYEEGKAPHLEQYSLTCETGPGSPSGHCMVTAAVLWVVASALVSDLSAAPSNSWKRNPIIRAAPWLIYGLILTAAGVSRLFIATHFPHQVLFGTAVGVLIGYVFNRVQVESFRPRMCVALSAGLAVSAMGLYGILLHLFNVDPSWSIQKAMQWCANPDWVHLGTTPFFSIARDSGSSLGLAVALHSILPQVGTMRTGTQNSLGSSSPEGKAGGVSTACFLLFLLSLTLSTEYWVLPQDPQVLLYSLVFVKSAFLTVAVIGLVTGFSKLIQKKQKNW
uniref:glucose-6-phosphatase n=1 Tax=Branchiostoma japonicum TaxID=373177 RepID=A0A0D4WTQ8_9BRAN|nr:glucose-6-phosphatase [Branchiostoma japonicum]